MVLASGAWICGSEFGIAERAGKGDNTSNQPQGKKGPLARGVLSNHRRRSKNADSDNDAYDNRAGPQNSEGSSKYARSSNSSSFRVRSLKLRCTIAEKNFGVQEQILGAIAISS